MSRLSIAALAAVALVSATAALAQNGAGSVPAPKESEQYDPMIRTKTLCIEHFARSAGRLAYLEAKLQLTAEQQPLWDKWRQTLATGAGKQRAECLADLSAAGTHPTILDRTSHFEQMMETKVATMQAGRPALEALYQALTPEQRLALDLPRHGAHAGHRFHHMSEQGQL